MDQQYQKYSQNGLSFQYPDGWTLSEKREDEDLSVTVESPETAFMTFQVLSERPYLEHVAESVLDAFRDEYDELDIYPTEDQLRDFPTLAYDIEFEYVEMLNSAYLRVYETDNATIMLLFQVADVEIEDSRAYFKTLYDSIGL